MGWKNLGKNRLKPSTPATTSRIASRFGVQKTDRRRLGKGESGRLPHSRGVKFLPAEMEYNDPNFSITWPGEGV